VSVIALPICDKGIDENVDSGSIKLTEVTILPENYGIQGYLNVFTYTQPINKIGGEFLPFCQTKTSFPSETFLAECVKASCFSVGTVGTLLQKLIPEGVIYDGEKPMSFAGGAGGCACKKKALSYKENNCSDFRGPLYAENGQATVGCHILGRRPLLMWCKHCRETLQFNHVKGWCVSDPTSSCEKCSQGRYYQLAFDETLDHPAPKCVNCLRGKYQDELHKDVCKACPPGRYGNSSVNNNNVNSCPVCKNGYYQPFESQSSCLKCPDGTTTHGSDSLDHIDFQQCTTITRKCQFEKVYNDVNILNSSCFMQESKLISSQTAIVGVIRENNKYADKIGMSKDNVPTLLGLLNRRVFFIEKGVVLNISNLKLTTIQNHYCQENHHVINNQCNYGGIYVSENAILYAKNVIFETNQHNKGGAIYLSKSSSVFLIKSFFLNNVANVKGGAIYLSSQSKLEMSHCHFLNNKCIGNDNTPAFQGLTIFTENNTTIMSNSSSFINSLYLNRFQTYAKCDDAINNDNGNMNLPESNRRRRRRRNILETTASSDRLRCGVFGGGIYVGAGSRMIFRNAKFKSNALNINPTSMITKPHTKYRYGGAFFLTNNSYVTFYNSTFKYNTAENGGVFYVYQNRNNLTFVNVTFTSNSANGSVGYVSGSSNNIYFENSVFQKNNAAKGGVMNLPQWSSNNLLQFKLCNLTENEASLIGGVVAIDGHSHHIYASSSSFSYNVAGIDGGVFYLTCSNACKEVEIQVNLCLFAGNEAVRYGGVLAYHAGATTNNDGNTNLKIQFDESKFLSNIGKENGDGGRGFLVDS